MYMKDSDQRPDSNRRPLLKSTSTDVIISNHSRIKGYSQISILSKFSDLWLIYWLGLRVRAYVSDIIGHRFEKVRNCRRFENWMSI